MVNTFFSANLVDYHTIRIALFSEIVKNENSNFDLVINGGDTIKKLRVSRQSFLNGLALFDCKSTDKIELGNDYVVRCRDIGSVSLNVNEATTFDDFEEDYFYDGDDLGATYYKGKTVFKIWAPLASRVSLYIKQKADDPFTTYKMRRGDKGVYEITLFGDYGGYLYRYSITNSGLRTMTTDPYAKGSTANGKSSVVIDFSKTNIDLHNDKLPVLKNAQDAIIYELHVRDFTIDKNTNIENKGKYLGIAEEGKKTNKNNPAGLDYLKYLGISHVQILPIYDYATVNELNPSEKYNWGYDPAQYFVPEGSYSTDAEDGYSRIIELKKMIAKLHENKIKINMDVVFNHVYGYEDSVLERVVPNYYFRKNRNGTLCNGSGCGNDVASERPMVRKLILDCIKYWTKEFGIDGYRFDLMGLMDIQTIKEVEKIVRSYKPDALIYGEGWDMYTNLPQDKKATIYNSFRTPNIGFFNDTYRDVARGNNDLKNGYLGYLNGNTSFIEGFKFVYLGSVVNYCYQPKFCNPTQSINYVECHDNCTLYDRIAYSYSGKDEESLLSVVKFVNAAVILSFGVPFIHSGQEIGLSKKGLDNTYNAGDEYNKFRWDLLDKRFAMVQYLSSIIKARAYNDNFSTLFKTPSDIENNNEFINLENGGLGIKVYFNKKHTAFRYIIFNPTRSTINVDLGEELRCEIGEAGQLKNYDIYGRNIVLKPFKANVFIKEDNE